MSEYREGVKELIDGSDAVEVYCSTDGASSWNWRRAVKTWESPRQVVFLVSHAYPDGTPLIVVYKKKELHLNATIRPIRPKKVKKKGYVGVRIGSTGFNKSIDGCCGTTTCMYETREQVEEIASSQWPSDAKYGITEIEWEEEA